MQHNQYLLAKCLLPLGSNQLLPLGIRHQISFLKIALLAPPQLLSNLLICRQLNRDSNKTIRGCTIPIPNTVSKYEILPIVPSLTSNFEIVFLVLIDRFLIV